MKKEEANTKPKKWGWIVWVIIIILALWVVGGLFDNSEEYSNCVDSCVSDNEDCVYDVDSCVSDSISYDKSGNGWISEYDFEDCSLDLEMCSLDLEMCVSDCQR